MMITLPDLPYAMNALEPYISEQTMAYHYGKHHATYVKNTNELIAGTEWKDKPLKDLILIAAGDTIYTALFNNAAQSFNHDFFWKSLTDKEDEKVIPPEMEERLTADFGSVDAFKTQFKKAAVGQFGSGWAWLVSDATGHLSIMTTGNADTPITRPEVTPLLCIDVWEHAYYLDHQNLRARYVDGVVDHLLNWRFAMNNLK